MVLFNGSLKLGVRISLCLCVSVVRYCPKCARRMSKMWGLEQESKMWAVNKNLNRQLETGTEMLLNLKNSCARPCSRISEMLDKSQWFCAQGLSRMSKITKMEFIKKRLNQSPEIRVEQHCAGCVQNEDLGGSRSVVTGIGTGCHGGQPFREQFRTRAL